MIRHSKRIDENAHNIVLDVSHLFCFLFRLRLTKKQNKCPPQGTFALGLIKKKKKHTENQTIIKQELAL